MMPERILIAAPNRWNEACFAIPAIKAMIASGLNVGILHQSEQLSLWQSINSLELITISGKAKPRAIALQLENQWDSSLAWEDGWQAESFQRAKIARRLGPSSDQRLSKKLTQPIHYELDVRKHRAAFYLLCVESMGIATQNQEFFQSAELPLHAKSNSVLLSPDSDFGITHEWSLERWELVAKELLKNGKKLTVACYNSKRSLGENLLSRLADSAESLNLNFIGENWQMLGDYEITLCADSSTAHLSAYAGSTCHVLFGPNDPAWKRPLGKRHHVIKQHVACAPCLSDSCKMDMRCQLELGTEQVIATFHQI